MDIAVFSDIHGNYVAFQKCLEYALAHKIETFIFLGDYLGEFPYPQETMKLIYELKDKYTCFFVKGNKEDYWINKKIGNSVEWKSGSSSTGALHYCYSNLEKRDMDFFESLPISSEVCIENMEPILACHGSPNRNNEKLLPNNDKTKEIIDQCDCKYILCGHTHIQQVIEYNGKVALNPGAIGVALHSEGKAQFMILHANKQEWEYEFISLDYDRNLVLKDFKESGLNEFAPFWSQITAHLIMIGEVSHGMVLNHAMKRCIEETGDCKWYDIPEKYWEQAINEMIQDRS